MRLITSLFVAAFLLTGLTLTGRFASAQETVSPSLTADQAVRMALKNSPELTAALRRLDAASAQVQGAKSPYNPQAELAPGVGFTNSNAVLSQRFDIGGKRSAESRRARGERSVVAASLDLLRHQIVTDAVLAYYDLVRVQVNLAAAEDAVKTARQIRDTVKKRVVIGEAPPVQQARAEIEVTRIEQDVVRAQGERKARQAALNLLLGRAAESPLVLSGTLTLPNAPQTSSSLVQQAQQSRPELIVATAQIEARQGEVDIARAAGRPDLYTDVVGDIWSLDRDASLRNQNRTTGTMGFQLRVGFPLFDRGGLRADVDRAKASVQAQEAERNALRRRIAIEVERATAELAALREVALNYQQNILPQSAELLRVVRSGFESGLTLFLDVLEAQRTHRQTQVEYQNALFDAARAQITLDRAVGILPAGVPAPPIIPTQPGAKPRLQSQKEN